MPWCAPQPQRRAIVRAARATNLTARSQPAHGIDRDVAECNEVRAACTTGEIVDESVMLS